MTRCGANFSCNFPAKLLKWDLIGLTWLLTLAEKISSALARRAIALEGILYERCRLRGPSEFQHANCELYITQEGHQNVNKMRHCLVFLKWKIHGKTFRLFFGQPNFVRGLPSAISPFPCVAYGHAISCPESVLHRHPLNFMDEALAVGHEYTIHVCT